MKSITIRLPDEAFDAIHARGGSPWARDILLSTLYVADKMKAMERSAAAGHDEEPPSAQPAAAASSAAAVDEGAAKLPDDPAAALAASLDETAEESLIPASFGDPTEELERADERDTEREYQPQTA